MSGPLTVVTEADVRLLPEGSEVRAARGAIVTPLARDTIGARRLRLIFEDDPEAARAEAGVPRGRPKRLAVGADHAGFEAKARLVPLLRSRGYEVLDLGAYSTDAVDYPAIALAVAESVARGETDAGMLLDGAGIGSAIAANKVPGVRAAMCYDVATARNSREHNGANVLALGARAVPFETLLEIVDAWLDSTISEATTVCCGKRFFTSAESRSLAGSCL